MVLHGIALHLMILHSPSCHCIVSYGVAWYCIVGFGARAVSRKTPTYFIYMLSFFLFLWILSFFCHSQAFLPALAALLLAFLKLPESLIGLLDQNDQELAVGGRNPISTIFPTTCAN